MPHQPHHHHEQQEQQQEQQRFQHVEHQDDDQLPELFDTNTSSDFQGQWLTIQSCFVDDPRKAVAQANALVEDMINRIVQSFDRARQNLESQWEGEGEASTEDLRMALMRYRSFFHRLLTTYGPHEPTA